MNINGKLPVFNVNDTPVDGSIKQRASHHESVGRVNFSTNGEMRATAFDPADQNKNEMSSTNKGTLFKALNSVKDNITSMFSRLSASLPQAQRKAEEFINKVVEQASQSATFELSLSSSASKFVQHTTVYPDSGNNYLVKEAWINIKGLDISVDNTTGEVEVNFNETSTDLSSVSVGEGSKSSNRFELEQVKSTINSSLIAPQFESVVINRNASNESSDRDQSGGDKASNLVRSSGNTQLSSIKKDSLQLSDNKSSDNNTNSSSTALNKATLRDLHGFLLTVNNVDGSEYYQARLKAEANNTAPSSADYETHKAQWQKEQEDPAFRHDIHYDDAQALKGKNEALMNEYLANNQTVWLNQASATKIFGQTESTQSNANGLTLNYDSLESIKQTSVDMLLEFLNIKQDFTLNSATFSAQKVSFNFDLSLYLGEISKTAEDKLELRLADNSVHDFENKTKTNSNAWKA